MKNLALILISLLILSCKSSSIAPADLPRDITLKPDNTISQSEDAHALKSKITQIEKLIAATPCNDPESWEFSPIGAKACGGPSSYIAYPKNAADKILPLIEEFTTMQRAYNKTYNIMSDCMLVPPPSAIQCENGKAVLMTASAEM